MSTCPVPDCDRPARGDWCPGHRKRWERFGDVQASVPLRTRCNAAESLQRKTSQRADGCWIWTAYTDAKGYGQVSVNGVIQRAHRVAYELFVGPIPDGLTLDHLCRNTSCVNPVHLEPVTAAENTRRQMASVKPKDTTP